MDNQRNIQFKQTYKHPDINRTSELYSLFDIPSVHQMTGPEQLSE